MKRSLTNLTRADLTCVRVCMFVVCVMAAAVTVNAQPDVEGGGEQSPSPTAAAAEPQPIGSSTTDERVADRFQNLLSPSQEQRALTEDRLAVDAESPSGGWFDLLQTLIALGIVLVGICIVVWVLKRFVGHTPMMVDRRVGRVVGRLHLSPKNVIFLVHVADRILVVGTTPNAIACLAEISDPATVGQIVEGRRSFDESLKRASRHIADESGAGGAPETIEEHIEDIDRQLERLKALEEHETESP